MSKLQELKSQFEAARARMQKEGKAALKEAIAEVFDAHPDLIAIRWTQYTPYFNDGDACEFSVGEPYISFKGLGEEEGDDGDGFDSWSEWSEKYHKEKGEDPYPKGFKQAYKAVAEIFCAIPDELMLSVFDDHVRVVATRKGFEAEEYSHD